MGYIRALSFTARTATGARCKRDAVVRGQADSDRAFPVGGPAPLRTAQKNVHDRAFPVGRAPHVERAAELDPLSACSSSDEPLQRRIHEVDEVGRMVEPQDALRDALVVGVRVEVEGRERPVPRSTQDGLLHVAVHARVVHGANPRLDVLRNMANVRAPSEPRDEVAHARHLRRSEKV
eukprot:CAMPEP_0119358708 /NCGR_PEP_ID=MMETSP1334-20130426/6840_1 /TAXON_ID=127549 /ORGANISM="Calcidiscus leptoporus, Strain RCC1130" /LENGTH=177 /DNA_ID=CAMNT_0007373253 /DNA_START=610 /DNA_END=1144 /DNA_ORIENTATION=+